jgi:hypothetical protein
MFVQDGFLYLIVTRHKLIVCGPCNRTNYQVHPLCDKLLKSAGALRAVV